MLELLGLVFGGLFRLAPEVLKIFQAKRDADHEFRMTTLQLEIDKARAQQQIDLANATAGAQASLAEVQAWADAIRDQSKPTGNSFIDALSASVRPVLTYYHLIVVYTLVKIAMFYAAYTSGVPWDKAMLGLYTDADRSLAWSMASFWFVDRSLRKK